MLKPKEFDYKESRLKDLYTFLKSKGFDVYFPEQHEGDCLSPYLVIRYDGTAGFDNVSSRRDLYTILCYVPKNQYSYLEEYVMKVRSAMKEVSPLFLVHDEQQLAAYFDEPVKGHYVSIEYKNYKKN